MSMFIGFLTLTGAVVWGLALFILLLWFTGFLRIEREKVDRLREASHHD